MLIDTHCHLTDERFNDPGKTLQEAYDADVKVVIIPSTNKEDLFLANDIAKKFGQFCLAGIHPEEISSSKIDVEEVVRGLDKAMDTCGRVVGVGEIGLDFFYDKNKDTHQQQTDLFLGQMQLALEKNLPVAIHMRDAEKEMKEMLSRMKNVPRGEFHCFSGSLDFLRMILDLGFFVGFGGNITYKSALNLREILKYAPLDRILLETDSPYLPPEPYRGTVNTPANVKITAEFMASELEIEFEELAKITTQNAKCLYSLDI